MKSILVIGAGRSAISLIDYLQQNAEEQGWKINIADFNPEAIKGDILSEDHLEFTKLDATDDAKRAVLISEHDLIISMLPARMHILVAKDCLELKKNLITPSYISPEMREMAQEVEDAGLCFMNELGVDPGIDHMSAMRMLDTMKERGAEITCFESFTGGLIAPESDNNPWNYKFTWNPRNVVLAGQGGAVKFRHNGMYKYIPYQKLFRRTEVIDIPGYGKFEGYANRNSLQYRELYNLDDVPTIYRGTLRRKGFCRSWNIFVQLGMTDDAYKMENWEGMTHREFTNSFLAYHPTDSVELKLRYYMKLDQDSDIFDKLEWLGLFESTPIGLDGPSSPAQILQKILEKKWSLDADDKDMIVMWHKLRCREDGLDHEREFHSSMVVIGDKEPRTAMAKTVGLPMGIAARLLLNGEISRKGVHAPMYPDIYKPILDELETHGIGFTENEVPAEEQLPA
jgi:saccharopine dehydrogenase-like NADP-dependent oxidoreductase